MVLAAIQKVLLLILIIFADHPRHFVGFWQVEEGEKGGGNVAQGAAVAEFSPVGGVNEYEGHGVGGVCGVGFAGVVV